MSPDRRNYAIGIYAICILTRKCASPTESTAPPGLRRAPFVSSRLRNNRIP